MITKLFILLCMMSIVISLGSGLILLVRDKGQNKRTIKALTWRISLSLLLFCFLFIGFSMGWIKPHGM